MASVWALGTVLNVEVPKTIKVVAKGRFPKFVTPKDLILYLIGRISAEGANFKVLEYHGPAFAAMPTSGRLTVCNMSVEAGRDLGDRPPGRGDAALSSRKRRGSRAGSRCSARTPDAAYDRTVTIDVAKLEPQIACPHTVDNVKPVGKVAGIKVDQIVIGSCTNGRLDDLAVAAKILKGKKVARGTRMLVFPASYRGSSTRPSKPAMWPTSSRPARWS